MMEHTRELDSAIYNIGVASDIDCSVTLDPEEASALITHIKELAGKLEEHGPEGHMEGKLTAERENVKRLREALGNIIDCDHHNFHNGPQSGYVRIAREALAAIEGKAPPC